MRRTLLATKLVEVGLDATGRRRPCLDGVDRRRARPTARSGSMVDTTPPVGARRARRGARHAGRWPTSRCVDPPLEQVIAEIYGAPGRGDAPRGRRRASASPPPGGSLAERGDAGRRRRRSTSSSSVAVSALWRAAAEANGGDGRRATRAAALTWYIATSEAASRCALNIRLIEEIGDDIAGGSVAAEMLRPALGASASAWPTRARPRPAPPGASCAAGGAVIAWSSAGAPPDGRALLLAAPALVLARRPATSRPSTPFAAAAFWVRDAGSTWFLYQKLVFILGGMLLPLEVLPGWLQTVARVLPFMAMAYVPARLGVGPRRAAAAARAARLAGGARSPPPPPPSPPASAACRWSADERRRACATLRSGALRRGVGQPRRRSGSQMTVMVVNDVVWVVFWLLFFDRVGTVRGWDTDRVLLLFAVLTTAGRPRARPPRQRPPHRAAGRRRRARRRPRAARAAARPPAGPADRADQPRRHRLRHRPVRRRRRPDRSGAPRIFVVGVLAGGGRCSTGLPRRHRLAGLLRRAGRDRASSASTPSCCSPPTRPTSSAAPSKLLLYTVVPAAVVATVPATLGRRLRRRLARRCCWPPRRPSWLLAWTDLHAGPAPLHVRLVLDPSLTTRSPAWRRRRPPRPPSPPRPGGRGSSTG